MDDSNKFSLSSIDWKKIAKGAGIAAAGGILAWASTSFVPSLQGSDSSVAIMIAGVLSVLVNAAQKFLTNTQKVTDESDSK